MYEYKCNKCGDIIELAKSDVRLVDETGLWHDEQICGGIYRRKYSLGGISFKGSGFYKNDN